MSLASCTYASRRTAVSGVHAARPKTSRDISRTTSTNSQGPCCRCRVA